MKRTINTNVCTPRDRQCYCRKGEEFASTSGQEVRISLSSLQPMFHTRMLGDEEKEEGCGKADPPPSMPSS